MKLTVSVRGGTADPVALELTTPTQPMSVGSAGEWPIIGPDVAPIAGYLYFDGMSLFVAAGDGATPTLEGRPVGAEWEAVPVPGEIRLGKVRLSVDLGTTTRQTEKAHVPPTTPPRAVLEETDEATVVVRGDELPQIGAMLAGYGAAPQAAAPAPSPVAGPPAPSAPAAASSWHMGPSAPPPIPAPPPDDEATRFGPIEARLPQLQARPLPVPPGYAPVAVEPAPAPVPTPGPLTPTVPGAAPRALTKPNPLIAAWSAASIPQKAIIALMPIAFVAVVYGLDDGSEPATTAGTVAVSAAAVASSSATSPSASNPTPSPANPNPPSPASAVAVAAPSAASAGKRKLKAGELTLERQATDALDTGDLPTALSRYERLVAENPTHPAFPVVIRVLKRRLGQAR